ncbi:MAG: cupin domain-containing protein [Chloroflexi bacterium]|nr:cupin domain-containing protein [Chloroflexota bacterium]
MKVIKISDVPKEVAGTSSFVGGPVTRQTLIGPQGSPFFNMAVVNFSPGARNNLHVHASDQILIVTAGQGIVATEVEEHMVGVGDVIHIMAGEKHWHGATRDSAFSHITLTAPDSRSEQTPR